MTTMSDELLFPTWVACNCEGGHRTRARFVKCFLPKAAWVQGEGEFGFVSRCRTVTVSLYESLDEAVHARILADAYGCGPFCRKEKHELVRILPSR